MVLASSLARAFTLSLVAIFHLATLILVAVTYVPHPEGMLLVGFAITNGVALLVILCFVLHRYAFRHDEPSNMRGRVTFGALLLISLVGSIIITVHAVKTSKDGACQSYSRMPHSCTLAVMVIALSWVATITAFQGLLIAHYGDLPGVVMVTPHVSQFYPTFPSVNEPSKREDNDSKMEQNAYNQWSGIAV